MKTVSVTIVYSNHAICNMSVNYRGKLTALIRRSPDKALAFDSFNAMYAFVLKHLKNNNFRCNSIEAFGAKWYDIQWIDYNTPSRIEKFGYRE